jgi:hypothetical protein
MKTLVCDLVDPTTNESSAIDLARVGRLRRNNGILRKIVGGKEATPFEELSTSPSNSKFDSTLIRINQEIISLAIHSAGQVE